MLSWIITSMLSLLITSMLSLLITSMLSLGRAPEVRGEARAGGARATTAQRTRALERPPADKEDLFDLLNQNSDFEYMGVGGL